MVKNLGEIAQALAAQLIALGVVWTLLVVTSWIMFKWCFKREISWTRAAHWITGVMGVVLVGMGIQYALPQTLTAPIAQVVIPHIVCAMALHGLLLAVDRYMRHRDGEGIISTRLVLSILLIYVFSILGAVGLIKIHTIFLTDVAEIVVDYLTTGAIVGLLVLEILGGRCKDQTQNLNENSSNNYSNNW